MPAASGAGSAPLPSITHSDEPSGAGPARIRPGSGMAAPGTALGSPTQPNPALGALHGSCQPQRSDSAAPQSPHTSPSPGCPLPAAHPSLIPSQPCPPISPSWAPFPGCFSSFLPSWQLITIFSLVFGGASWAARLVTRAAKRSHSRDQALPFPVSPGASPGTAVTRLVPPRLSFLLTSLGA